MQINITPTMRVIQGVSVYSFYGYSDVSLLIQSKYYVFGSRILKILAAKASDYFFSIHCQKPSFWKDANLYGVGVDDCVRSYYSHSAVILKEFCRYGFKATYGKLQAKNIVQYAGKSLEYRQKNPRNLSFNSQSLGNFFIVDDIITTGTTMAEAITEIEKSGSKVLFCIALCDAKY